jgi:hypothetical protein
MANLRPFRDYNEHDVINMFAFDGAPDANGVIATKGTAVKIASANGVQPVSTSALGSEVVELDLPAGNTYNNTVSYRYSAVPKISKATSSDMAIGILLYDVRELDENGEKLSYNPRKAAEMNVVVSGQAVPVLTKGTLLYEGLNTTLIPTSASAGDALYVHSTAGELSTIDVGSAQKVGYLLGKPVAVNGKGLALVKLNF